MNTHLTSLHMHRTVCLGNLLLLPPKQFNSHIHLSALNINAYIALHSPCLDTVPCLYETIQFYYDLLKSSWQINEIGGEKIRETISLITTW